VGVLPIYIKKKKIPEPLIGHFWLMHVDSVEAKINCFV